MTDRARRLLDNLLGPNRNIRNGNKDNIINNKCIYQIAGCCPYELLKNTKLSIGSCKFKDHSTENKSSNKILYEQELLKILSELFINIENNISKDNFINKDEYINKEEINLDIKISYIENNINNENILEMYDKFIELEKEIYDLEKMKENFYVKNKNTPMEKCKICGMSIIKNFCSKKYISHINGRAHNGIIKLFGLYKKLLNRADLRNY